MDQSAVQAIAELACQASSSNHLGTDTPALILHDDCGSERVVSIEHLQAGRSRYRGTFATLSLQAFADYVIATDENANGEGVAQGFINPEKMTSTVYFNLGDNTHPGHADHTANLKLKLTAAYDALLTVTGGLALDQRRLHDFVEDWRDNITVLYDGEPREQSVPAALAAIRDITVESARKVTHVDRDMGATRSAMESVDARSDHSLPSGFEFRCVPYDGLAERTFRLRLGVNTGNDKLTLVLRIQQAEQHTEAIAADFLARLGAKLGTASSLTLGTFTP